MHRGSGLFWQQKMNQHNIGQVVIKYYNNENHDVLVTFFLFFLFTANDLANLFRMPFCTQTRLKCPPSYAGLHAIQCTCRQPVQIEKLSFKTPHTRDFTASINYMYHQHRLGYPHKKLYWHLTHKSHPTITAASASVVC